MTQQRTCAATCAYTTRQASAYGGCWFCERCRVWLYMWGCTSSCRCGCSCRWSCECRRGFECGCMGGFSGLYKQQKTENGHHHTVTIVSLHTRRWVAAWLFLFNKRATLFFSLAPKSPTQKSKDKTSKTTVLNWHYVHNNWMRHYQTTKISESAVALKRISQLRRPGSSNLVPFQCDQQMHHVHVYKLFENKSNFNNNNK